MFKFDVLIINILFFVKLHVTIDNFLWKTFFMFDTYVFHAMAHIFHAMARIFYTGLIYMSLQNFKYFGKYESRVDACPQMITFKNVYHQPLDRGPTTYYNWGFRFDTSQSVSNAVTFCFMDI